MPARSFATLAVLATACASESAYEPQVVVELVDPDGTTHTVDGPVGTLIEPFADDVTVPYSADGVLTRDPAAVLAAIDATVPHFEGGLRKVRRVGDRVEHYYPDHVHATYAWSEDMSSMRITVHDGATMTLRVHGEPYWPLLEGYLGRVVLHTVAGGNLHDFLVAELDDRVAHDRFDVGCQTQARSSE